MTRWIIDLLDRHPAIQQPPTRKEPIMARSTYRHAAPAQRKALKPAFDAVAGFVFSACMVAGLAMLALGIVVWVVTYA